MNAAAGFDTWLFYLFNTGLTSPFLDAVTALVTLKWFLPGAFTVGGGLAFVFGSRALRWSVVLAALVYVVSDLTVVVLKEFFSRTRPCHVLEGARALWGCGHSYAFPSAHAADVFAVTALLSARHFRYSGAFLTLAVIVAWSRVYAGVHYPLDVAAGAILGSVLAWGLLTADKKFGDALVERVKSIIRSIPGGARPT